MKKIVLPVHGALDRNNGLKLQRIELAVRKIYLHKDNEYNKFPEESVFPLVL